MRSWGRILGPLLLAAAGWTWFVWVFRLVAMAGEDRSTGYVLAHGGVATLSLLLAVPVALVGWRMTRARS